MKAHATGSPYDAWSAGVRSGAVVLSNGPLLEMKVDKTTRAITASASFYRPLEKLEIVSNGEVIAAVSGDGKMKLTASARVANLESCWVAARVSAKKNEGEPDIQAHTNPVYLLSGGKPVRVNAARESLAKQWEEQLAWYRSTPMVFRDEAQKRDFFDRAERTRSKSCGSPCSTASNS